jgi:hypothetical protein
MSSGPSQEELAKLRELIFQYDHAQTIFDAWKNDASCPSDKYDKAENDFEAAAEALDAYREELIARYPKHEF